MGMGACVDNVLEPVMKVVIKCLHDGVKALLKKSTWRISKKLRPAALTSMRSSPFFGSGTAASTTFISSGPLIQLLTT